MRTCICHDCFSIFVKERNNGLFSRGAFGSDLDFFGSLSGFIECCIVDFHNLLVR